MSKFLNIILILVAVGVVSFLPALANVLTADDVSAVVGNSSNLYFVWIMFPAWIYLGGALTMLTLSVKHMSGGSLSKPFTLMGFGVLVDSLAQILSSLIIINLVPDAPVLSSLIFVVSIVSRLSIVFGMVWVASIFGVLQNK